MEDHVREIDEALDLLVAVGRRRGDERDRVSVPDGQIQIPPERDRYAVELDGCDTVTVLGNQFFDVDLARRRRTHDAEAVSGCGDVKSPRRIIG